MTSNGSAPHDNGSGWRGKLSHVIPVRMRSSYVEETGAGMRAMRVTWWEWRGRMFRARFHEIGA